METWNGWNQIAGMVCESGMDSPVGVQGEAGGGAPGGAEGVEGATEPGGTGAVDTGTDVGAQPGQPQEPSKGKLRDQPLTQERFNEVWKERKQFEEDNAFLKAQLEDHRSQLQDLRRPAPAPIRQPEPSGIRLPKHLESLSGTPEGNLIIEVAQEIAKQIVSPLEGKFKAMEEAEQNRQAEVRKTQLYNDNRRQFEAHGQSVLDELQLTTRYPLPVARAIFQAAREQLIPVIMNSREWDGLGERSYWLKYRQELKARVVAAEAEFSPHFVKQTAPQPDGTPLAARLPGAAPVTTPDPMMEKFRRGEADSEEVMSDFLHQERKKRR